jgi:Zn-finger nucleic acid-binding protein
MKHEKIEPIWADVCHDHGVWLDRGEIESIMEMIKERGKAEGFVDSLWSSTHF